jgi:DNA-binding SARP family transcriptional activator
LGLLRSFQLTYEGREMPVSLNGQKLLALLALSARPLPRSFIAGTLWANGTEERAYGNLRSAIWRLRTQQIDFLETSGECLTLSEDVKVDVREAEAQANRLLHGSAWSEHDCDGSLLSWDLLPTWAEDWVLVERERLHQLRMHALERLCEMLVVAGRCAHAVSMGVLAVQAEPLRESAHRALIGAHIAEGNIGEALAQYAYFKRLIRDELQLAPSRQMEELICQIRVI